VVLPSGERISREKGTPQGGVISPLLANIFLHLVFDQWIQKHFPCIHFERYADDIVVHCRSESQLKMIAHQIRRRFTQCGLELCEEKTKIVYCKDSNRSGSYPNQSFDFLGYTFRPRSVRDSNGRFFVSFSPAVSRKALKAMRAKLKGHPLIKAGYHRSIEELARAINPIIQGWIAYYGKFRKSAMSAIYSYINDKLLNWIRRKFKPLKRRKWRAGQWLRELYRQYPTLFAHWRVWRWVAE
jgi:RNA-directed DNA polymerase